MRAIRFELPVFPGEDTRPGDLWRVASVDGGKVAFERVQAEPGTFRKRGDGLWPPLPDARPISDEEAQRLNAEMDAAMAKGRAAINAWPFSPDNPLNWPAPVDDRVRG